jgi:hypothetical protein
VDWYKVEQEILTTISEFINNPINDIGWKAYALITTIRSYYTIKEVGFTSKVDAVKWIIDNPKYSKYRRINYLLLQYTDHFTDEDRENIRSTDFAFSNTYLRQILNDIKKLISCN